MELLIPVLHFLAGNIVLLCMAFYLYYIASFNHDYFYQSQNWNLFSRFNKVVTVGAYLGFFLCFQQGAYLLLSWMPSEWGTFDEDGGFNLISTTASFFFALYGISIVPSKVESIVNERNLNHFNQEISKFREEVFNKYTLTKTLYESKSKISKLLGEVQKEILLKCGNRTEEYRVFAQVKEFHYKNLLSDFDNVLKNRSD